VAQIYVGGNTVRSFIYIPIFITGGPVTSNAPERVITPSKMSAIRCLSEDVNTISGLRPIPVEKAIDIANKAGFGIR
jgi:hypothetical protein